MQRYLLRFFGGGTRSRSASVAFLILDGLRRRWLILRRIAEATSRSRGD